MDSDIPQKISLSDRPWVGRPRFAIWRLACLLSHQERTPAMTRLKAAPPRFHPLAQVELAPKPTQRKPPFAWNKKSRSDGGRVIAANHCCPLLLCVLGPVPLYFILFNVNKHIQHSLVFQSLLADAKAFSNLTLTALAQGSGWQAARTRC